MNSLKFSRFTGALAVFMLTAFGAIAQTSGDIPDNTEMKTLYKNDQSDRKNNSIPWHLVAPRDSARKARVYELLDSNLIRTAKDYYHAAMIFQHGHDTVSSGMAIQLMRKAVSLDTTMSKWLLAAAIDRDLMRRNKPQIYGTQYWKRSGDSPWELYDIDTTVISDEERKAYKVRTLAQQRMRVKIMNKKKLYDLTGEKSIEQIMLICQQDNSAESEYDVSESGINRFGYQLMAEERFEDALKIFRLNTELYPKGYNTYDSYGECLLKTGRKEEAIAAYQRSLELNPKNSNAIKVLEEIRAE